MSNYLITGYHGEPHVTAENDRGINAAIFGAGRFVLPVGEQFRAEYIGNNTVRVYDGKLVNNGACGGIPVGEYVDLLISNASQGMNRNDLIVFQYAQDSSTLVESGTFVVVQGTETSGTASDPELTQEDLLSGTATFDQMALWRVAVSSTAISAPEQVFELASMTGEAMNFLSVAAAGNGTLDDALEVDWSDPYADINKPRRVGSYNAGTTANVPEDFGGGMRFVATISNAVKSGAVVLVGQDSTSSVIRSAIWINCYVYGYGWRGWCKAGGRNIYYSTTQPSDWKNGDIWLKPV